MIFVKTWSEKEKNVKMLNTYIFFFLHSVFKDLKCFTISEGKKKFEKHIYHIPSSEILEFPSVINFDIITSDHINFHFHFLP